MIHFELVCTVRGRGSTSCMSISVILALFVEKTINSPFNYLQTLVENQLTISSEGLSLSILFLGFTSTLLPVSHCPDYYSFLVSFVIGKCESSNFTLLFEDCFRYSGSPEFPYEFQDQLVNVCKKKCTCDFNRDCGESVDQFGEHWGILPF